jgi:hypothetical protein
LTETATATGDAARLRGELADALVAKGSITDERAEAVRGEPRRAGWIAGAALPGQGCPQVVETLYCALTAAG